VPEHRFFHERVARTDRDAVAARDATGLADGRSAVPQHARMRVVPIDGKRLVHFDVLTSFHAAAAQDALVGIVTVEGICVVDFVRLGLERDLLVLNGQQFCRVVYCAISIVVVADGAVEHVITKDAVKRLLPSRMGF
jgi:hypothetical protein